MTALTFTEAWQITAASDPDLHTIDVLVDVDNVDELPLDKWCALLPAFYADALARWVSYWDDNPGLHIDDVADAAGVDDVVTFLARLDEVLPEITVTPHATDSTFYPTREQWSEHADPRCGCMRITVDVHKVYDLFGDLRGTR